MRNDRDRGLSHKSLHFFDTPSNREETKKLYFIRLDQAITEAQNFLNSLTSEATKLMKIKQHSPCYTSSTADLLCLKSFSLCNSSPILYVFYVTVALKQEMIVNLLGLPRDPLEGPLRFLMPTLETHYCISHTQCPPCPTTIKYCWYINIWICPQKPFLMIWRQLPKTCLIQKNKTKKTITS